MKARRVWALVLAATFAWASPSFGQSQAINGTIEGTIKDAQGGVLPGVTVTVTSTHGLDVAPYTPSPVYATRKP